MSYAGGEWTALAVGIALLLATVGLIVWVLRKYRRSEWALVGYFVAMVLAVGGFSAIGGSMIAAVDRQATLQATHAIQRQGFQVLSVDLALSHSQATLYGPGHCIVHRDVQGYGHGKYQVVWNGHPGDPAKLNCDGS